MEKIYQDVPSATSIERLLNSEESDERVPPNSSHDDYDPNLVQRFIPIKRKTISSYLRLTRDLVIYALAIVGLFMIIQHIVHKAQQVHHIHHVHHTHQEHLGLQKHEHYAEHQEHQEHHMHQAHPGNPPLPNHCDCGNSTTTALSLSCKYDSLAAAWLPPHCRDDALTAEFETLGPGLNGTWIYWADSAHTQPINLSTIAAMADEPSARFHMSYDWHVVHCIFYWRKQFRARLGGMRVEGRDDSEEHILHCGRVVRERVWGTVAGVALNTDF